MLKIQEYLIHNIKFYRKKAKLTQEKLAILSDTSTNYIGLIEIGRRFPSYDLIQRIADNLNIEVYKLFLPTNTLSTEEENNLIDKEKLSRKLSTEIEKVIEKIILE